MQPVTRAGQPRADAMMDLLSDAFNRALGLGLDIGDVGPLQMALRTVVVYAAALALVRLGSKRFLSQASAFDVIVAIMLGSIMSRGINGSAPMLSTVASGAALVGIHWVLAVLAYRIDWLGPVLKGQPITLIVDGVIRRDGMRRAGVSRHDLEQALRAQGGVEDPAEVRLATFERDGTISVLRTDARRTR